MAGSATAPAAYAGAATAAQARTRAEELKLWDLEQWLRLGHWRPAGFPGQGWESDAFADGFFLSPSGRTDPRAELEAALEGLFAVDASSRHPRCRFPARSAWLIERLAIAPGSLPPADCSEYEAWRGLLDARSVSLVFASAYLNNPSSMFGHTFLRLERSKTGENERLLDNTLNYAAETGDSNGFAFAIKGLFGLYPGRYSMMPYHMKVQEYGGIENRDLWEYRLALSPEEVDRLAAHAWEMGQATFPYFFFSKNCSYQLMPALEAAAPRLSLLRGSPVAVAPAETVRAIAEVPGLVRETKYRPSHATVMRGRRGLLSPAERRAAEAFAFGRVEEGDRLLASVEPSRRALALDSAQDYVLFKKGFNPEAPPEVREVERAILVRRAKLPEPPVPAPEPRWNAPPEAGHARHRFLLGGGTRREGRFAELAYRPGYHDLLDSPRGFPNGAAIEVFSARGRWDFESRRAHLHDARFAEILSVSPWDPWARKPSWSAGTGAEAAYEKRVRPDRALVWEGHVGSGVAAEPAAGVIAFGLLQAESRAGSVLDKGYRVGGALRLGVSARLGARVHALLDGALSGAAAGDKTPDHRLRAGLNWRAGRDAAVRLEGGLRGHHREGSLSVVLYR